VYGQKISKYSSNNILVTADKYGIDSAFSLIHQRTGYFYLDLIDTNLASKLCGFVEDLDLDRSKFSTHFITHSAEVLTNRIINEQLLKLLNKYQGVYTHDSAYLEYPNYNIFKSIASQNFKSSLPNLNNELNYWNQFQNNLTDTNLRNYRIVSQLTEWLKETIKYISEFDSVDKSGKNYFNINKNNIDGRLTISKWDTIILTNKTNAVHEVKFKSEPYIKNQFNFEDFLRRNSNIEIIYNQNKAIICMRYNSLQAVHQIELINERKLSIRYLRGWIE
jgi:hypothetical protein